MKRFGNVFSLSASGNHPPYLADLIFIKFREVISASTYIAKSSIKCVSCIVCKAYVLQVIRAIVTLISVYVIHAHFFRLYANEGFCDQVMDVLRRSFAFNPYANNRVSDRSNSRLLLKRLASSFYVAKITRVIESKRRWYFFPNFLHVESVFSLANSIIHANFQQKAKVA